MGKVLNAYALGDLAAVYLLTEGGNVGLGLAPARRRRDAEWDKGAVDPMAQFSVAGDAACPGFAAGLTRHDSSTALGLRYVRQSVSNEGDKMSVHTRLVTADGRVEAVHRLSWHRDWRGVEVDLALTNRSDNDVTLEAASSFSLGGITPFAPDDAPERLKLHRFRSYWSAEGQRETRTIEELMLEPSWARHGVRAEVFGAAGSMPVRGYFPFAAVEDAGAGVTWAAALDIASSWQMEAFRKDENLCLAGGIADMDRGQWRKTLAPGETFTTPAAWLTVAEGGLDAACDRLLTIQKQKRPPRQRKRRLPLLFNEYCTTWGSPSEAKVEQILECLRGRGFDRFIVDAGWYADPVHGWQGNMGDWVVSEAAFPRGLAPVCAAIRAAGMTPGIWFEPETVGEHAEVAKREDLLLTRGGEVIVSGTRRFFDLRKPEVTAWLDERVLGLLRGAGFGYVKLDYNESMGVGCDGAESLGEGLRQNVAAAEAFFDRLYEELPELEIEICASGGHRLVPPMMARADYLSFSDAHEEPEIPVIAANLHRLALPEKSQIWAVLRASDSEKRLMYSLCAAMYGVMCLSGDVTELTPAQWALVDRGTTFYKRVSPIIIDGVTRVFGPVQKSLRHLKGWQAGVRANAARGETLVIVHSFSIDGPQSVRVPVGENARIVDRFEASEHGATMRDGALSLHMTKAFDAAAFLCRAGERA